MRTNDVMRQFHRWISAAFVLSVIATTIAMSQEQPLIWVAYIPLLPLALLSITGLYLFIRPYAARWRGQRHAGLE